MGPLFWHEMRRLGRRAQHYWLRLAFISALAGLYAYCYYAALEDVRNQARFALQVGGVLFYGNDSRGVDESYMAHAMARMGLQTFGIYVAAEAFLAMILCPLLVAGCLAEERRQGTMDLLLTSELSPWEIVAGKMLPRVLLFGLLVFGGGVIMVLAQFQGGIDPLLVSLSTLVLLSGMLSQGALTMWLAARGGSPTWVLFMSCLALTAWLLVGWTGLPRFLVRFEDILPWANAAAMLRFLRDEFRGAGVLEDWPIRLTLVHMVVHVGLTGLFLWLAARSLRWGHEQTQISPAPNPRRLSSRWGRRRPALDVQRPLLWKERGATALWSRVLWLVGGGIILVITTNGRMSAIVLSGVLKDDEAWRLCLLFTALFVPMLLAASRAVWSLQGEVDRATWDALLTTPLRLRQILWAKWLGSVLGVVQPLIVLGLVGGCGAAAAGRMARWVVGLTYRDWYLPSIDSWTAILLLMSNSLAAVILAAAVGLLMAVISKSVLRAYVATFVMLILYCTLPWMIRFGLYRESVYKPGEVLVFLLNIFEVCIYYFGLPLIVVLSLGFFSARLRHFLRLIIGVVVVPLLIGLMVQVPLVVVGVYLSLVREGRELVLLMSPPGFVKEMADRWAGFQRVPTWPSVLDSELSSAPVLGVVVMQLLAAGLIWLFAYRWACYKSERIGDHWRSQRPRPVPPARPLHLG